MKYNDFKDFLKTEMEKRFPENNVEIVPVVKNNDTVLDGMCIKGKDSNIFPSIYLNEFYQDYENGRSIENIADAIADIRMENDVADNFDIAKILDWEVAKGHIGCKLINAEENSQYLSDKPFTPLEDLAVTYHIVMNSDEMGSATVPIHNNLMDRLGVDVETLHQTAIENMDTLMPAKFTSMQSVMEEMLLPDMLNELGISEEEAKELILPNTPKGDPGLYVLTNESKVNGAACIVNPKIMEQIKEAVGGEYYVLPSSIHETLILPKTADSDYRELEAMVQDVNATQLTPEEKLSDHVYEYDAASRQLMRSDTAQERKAMLAQPQQKTEERKSLKEKLEEKRAMADAIKPQLPKSQDRQVAQGLA